MANPDFPSIQVNGRSYIVSGYPTTITRNPLNGRAVVFLHGSRPAGLVIDLQFESATNADRTAIDSHYGIVKQQGWFKVPATVWQAHVDQFRVLPWNYYYRYIEPPTPTKEGTSPFYTVTVRLSVRF